jgi:4-amino-4-deoxy-L-arabinose transferase-like glycosyltransferase
LIAAIMAMTFFGLLAKARFAGAEIEGVYVPLFGIAMTLWLAWRCRGITPWLVWCIPFVFLGLGLLTKPAHLLFFYAVVGAVLWRTKSLKELLHPAHFVGIALIAAIFAAWFIPYSMHAPQASEAPKVWWDQLVNRVVENKSSWLDYAMNLPRGLGDLLPWVLLAPALVGAIRRGDGEQSTRWIAAVTLAVSASVFVGMLLIPGLLPRYALPLIAPMALGAALLLEQLDGTIFFRWHRVNQVVVGIVALAALVAPVAAAVLIGEVNDKRAVVGFDWPAAVPAIGAATATFAVAGYLWSRRAVMLTPSYLAISSAAVLGAASLLYGTAAPRLIATKDDLRPLAGRINKSIPAASELVIYDPDYQAAFFYLACRHRYAPETRDIPAGAEFVLVRTKDVEKVRKKRPEYVVTFEYKRKGEPEFMLLQPLGGKSAN